MPARPGRHKYAADELPSPQTGRAEDGGTVFRLKWRTVAGSKPDPVCHDVTSARISSEMSLWVPAAFVINLTRILDRAISCVAADTFQRLHDKLEIGSRFEMAFRLVFIGFILKQEKALLGLLFLLLLVWHSLTEAHVEERGLSCGISSLP